MNATIKNATGVVLICSLLLLGACAGDNNDSKDMAENTNKENLEKDMRDEASFLVDAASINLEEIQLGKLAVERASMQDAKDLGSMMVADHEKAYNELKALADSKGITVPSAPDDKAMEKQDKLDDLTGIEFDKEYADMMVKGHKDAIDKFENAEVKCEDPDVKNFISKMLPGLQGHLQASENCQDKAKNAK